MTVTPSYRELSESVGTPAGAVWGAFTQPDDLGMLNFLTPDRTARAAKLVRSGAVYNLDYPINTFVPSISGTRPETEHHIFANNVNHRDDWLDSFYLQSTSQIDGLRHMRHPEAGFYDGAEDGEIAEGLPRLGIHHVAEHGIAGRGVLLDMPKFFSDRGEEMSRTRAFTPADLEEAADHQGVGFESGDILLLHTGWAERYLSMTAEERRSRRGSAGLHQSQDMLEWLWSQQFSLVAADNPGLEAFPIDRDSGFVIEGAAPPERGPDHNGMMHRSLIPLLGLMLGELWNLAALARACAADGEYAFLLTAKPLNLIGGVGSPPNAMAIK
ncbi:cyclase family protein [Microbacterium sp.]|uniref:cyclase family protein n=1 Tax=Microbacterium sp. TaxID=51671 RepID=UPI002736DAF6|nr:cyclase family protein [Microbacterium sp.]MDP3951856.1 cyclase family protein [Microbacterium sp.]